MIATMDGTTFNKLISATKKFTSKASSNPLHEWIRLEFSEAKCSVVAVAVDGFRMAVEHGECDEVDNDFTAYIKPKMRKMPRSVLVTVCRGDDIVYIQADDDIVGYVQPCGDSIDHEKILNDIYAKPVSYRIAFNGDLLIEAIQSAAVGTDAMLKEPIVLEFRDEQTAIILKTGDEGNENIKLVLPVRIRKWTESAG